ncbi:MAG: YihY/virulence factor BrkB family protein [Caldilineales bacterium]|nr:YihY/virulence factor BrkB family protein [Caldilineales bacterium]
MPIPIALRRFGAAAAAHELNVRAAALAYYAVFSLFPLVLLALGLLGYLLPDPTLPERIGAFFADILPGLADVVFVVVAQALARRQSLGLIGAAGLLWSASGFFGGLGFAIHRVFDEGPWRSPWLNRGLGLAMVLLSGGLLLMLVFLLFLLGAVAGLPFWPTPVAALLRHEAGRLGGLLATGLALFLLYRYIPRRRPRPKPVLVGAGATTLALLLLVRGFEWYLRSPLMRLDIVYGSIATFIALLLFLYLAGLVILYGAELSAQLDRGQTTT